MAKITAKAAAPKPYHHGHLRARLLELAMADLEAVGIAGVSLRGLAARAGVSKTAPNRHFADRNSLLEALTEMGWGQLKACLEAAVEAQTAAADGLRALGRAYVAFALGQPGLYRLLFSPEGKARANALACADAEKSLGLLTEWVERCQRSGVFAPADSRVITLRYWALVHGISDLASQQLVAVPEGVSKLEFWQALVETLDPAGLH